MVAGNVTPTAALCASSATVVIEQWDEHGANTALRQ
jgi:hypothetical protein